MSRFGKLKARERTHAPPDHRMRDTALDLFGESALAEIEGILGVASPEGRVRESLARSLYAYARDRAGNSGHSGEGSPAQIRQRIKTISKAARSLQAALASNGAAETVACILEGRGIDMMLLNDFIAELTQIKTGPGGKRLADPEHWLLMDRVADIFERTAQERATLSETRSDNSFNGPLFKMARYVEKAAAKAVQRRELSDSALGSRLKRLLKIRNKSIAKLRA
jgi:hypothetical protein